jgi:hypothetical protein
MINSVIPPRYWLLSGNFGLNTNLLETNLINLGVMLSLLVYFGKGMCEGCMFRQSNWYNPATLQDIKKCIIPTNDF